MAQRNRRNISFPTWTSPRTTMMTMTMRKRSPYPMTTNRPPVPRTHTNQQEGALAAVGPLSRAPPTPRPPQAPAPVRSTRRGGCGSADEPPHQAAGELCSPGGAGRRHREPSPPAVRAAPPAAASPPVWSCPHPSTACPPGLSCPHPADMSHLHLKEDHLPSDPSLRFVPFPPAATGHKPGPLLCRSGYSTGPLDTCHGRVPAHRVVMSNW